MREIYYASYKNITLVKMFTCWDKRTPTPPPPFSAAAARSCGWRCWCVYSNRVTHFTIQARPKKTPDSGTELASIATLVH